MPTIDEASYDIAIGAQQSAVSDASSAIESAPNPSSQSAFSIESLTEKQQIRLTHALDEYLQSLEQGTCFDIDEYCREEPVLRQALSVYLEKLNALYGLTADGQKADATIPKTLGEFRLEREIGRGGMGIVYEARQASMDRRVALKLLPLAATLDDRQIARFKNESRAAGALHHPNIVPVYSVGETDGIHFYAMQLIDGQSVDHGIRRQQDTDRSQPPDARGKAECWKSEDWQSIVRWAIDAAEALHAAHETGVIHRDIKPSNLMIDRAGKIWVTDFGLARCQSDSSLTRSGDVIGTMRYMSPEQAGGQSAWVDGRTDIYSLAVTVYEMLSLRQACPGDDGPSILKAIDQNLVVPLCQICERIPRDLETVIAKAMSKSRDDRYETSRAFADDLRRVLAGEPTLARPATIVDRISRFSSKHKSGVLLAVLVCALGFVGFAISTALIAAEKRVSDLNLDRAQQSDRLARNAVDRLGSQMAELLAGVPSAEPVRRQLLQETLRYYQTFAEASADTPELRRDLAITYGKIGTLQDELRSNANAVEALRKSERLYGELAGENASDTATLLDWSISQNNLAESLHRAGELKEAAVFFARAIKTQEQLAKLQSDPNHRIQLATTLNNLGSLLTATGASNEAEQAYLRSVELLTPADELTPHPDQQDQLAAVLANLSALLAENRPQSAIHFARQALDKQTSRLEQDGGNAKLARQVIVTLQTIAMAYSHEDRHESAVGSYQQAVDIGRQLLSRWPDQPQYQRDFVISQNHLGLELSKIGKLTDAHQAFVDALSTQQQLALQYADDAETQSMLGGVLNNLGFLQQRLGQSNAAIASYNDAVKHQSKAVTLAPQVERYRNYLKKHQYNLAQMETSR